MTRFVNTKNSGYRRVLDWHGCGLDDPGSEIPESLRRHAVRVQDKTGYGIAKTEDLLPVNTRQVVVAGCDTDACVMAMCFNLWDRGIEPLVHVPSCGSSAGQQVHDAALAMIERQFGVLLTDEE